MTLWKSRFLRRCLLAAAIALGGLLLFGLFGTRSYYEMMSDDALIIATGTTYTSICCICTLPVFVVRDLRGGVAVPAKSATTMRLYPAR